jgi:hypothetical protein
LALTRDISSLLKETIDKSLIIVEQNAKLEHFCALVKEPTTTNDVPQWDGAIGDLEDTKMEVNAATLDHVVVNVTYRVLEPVSTPICQRRASFMPPLVQYNNHWTYKKRKIPCLFHPTIKLLNFGH